DLQWHAAGVAVGTLAAPLLQQVLTHLIAREGPLLVFHARDFRVLERLHVKAHQLRADGRDGCEAAKALDPRQGGVHAVLQGRREPPWLAGTIQKARCTVPKIAAPAATHAAPAATHAAPAATHAAPG